MGRDEKSYPISDSGDGPGGQWVRIDGKLKQVAIGNLGVFGVDSADFIYYRIGTYNNPTSQGDGWQRYVTSKIP